jgi:adenylate cyclase
MAPEQLADLLNRYLGAMSEIVLDEQGTLDKYIGDAVMAIFNAPLPIPHHPVRATAAALGMFRRLRELNRAFIAEFGIELQIGVGLHTGPAIVGNLGSVRRFDYTAIGDTVNLGSRLEGITKQYGVNLLISDTTRAALGEEFLCRPIDRIRVKGKYAAVEIHEVLDPVAGERQRELAMAYEEALRAYFAGDFARALAGFETLLVDFPDDRPSRLMAVRCRQYLNEPPETWDGVFVALEK